MIETRWTRSAADVASAVPGERHRASERVLLPTDRGVGAASFLYTPCDRNTSEVKCKIYLVMPDGTQYVLEDEASVGRFGLSPDGRWLAWTDSFWPGTGTMHVRDLTGTKEITFGEDGGSSRELHATAWSPQSKYLLVYVSYGTQARVDLATGAVLTFTTTASQIDMVLDSGELLAIMNRNPDELVSIDAVTGAETSKFQITGLNTEDVRSVWPAPAACSCSAWCSSTPGTATSIIR